MKKLLAVLLCVATMITMFSTMFASASNAAPAAVSISAAAPDDDDTSTTSSMDWSAIFSFLITIGKLIFTLIPFSDIGATIKGMIDDFYNR